MAETNDPTMSDREFFDTLFQVWSKTTGAADTYWIVEYDEGSYEDVMEHWTVWAVPEEGERIFIGDFEREEDADYTAAMHGCLSDLVRRLHMALDEADRLDMARDEAENALASEILLNMELQQQLRDKDLPL